MKFGEIAVADAEGAILAHSVSHGAGVFKKGRVLSAADLTILTTAGVARVFAARLGEDDVPEDEAAAAVAERVAGVGTTAQEPFTGRANLHADSHGLAVIDVDRVQALNRLHESLTLATVAPFTAVEARQMVATVKVIPFAVPRDVLEQALAILGNEPMVRVEAFRHRRAGLVITRLPQTKASLVKKSEESIRQRIVALGGELAAVEVCDHAIAAVTAAVAGLHGKGLNPILVFGASAIVDRGDVIPAGLARAGGEVVHLGMPVDPGNLLMFGRLHGVPVVGVPTCARSPKLNGFDWVLARVMAGIHLAAEDIMDMGAGGLLTEIPSRPSPREARPEVPRAPAVAAIVLAAGSSTRMGFNKLLADVGGQPMIRRSVTAVLASAARPVIVVTGRDADKVAAALDGLDVVIVHNPDFQSGLSGSLRRGLEAVPESADAALVCLGDMPAVMPRTVNRLMAAFAPSEHRTICIPIHDGRRGNPVLWGRGHFAAMKAITGDRGARGLIDEMPEECVEIQVGDDSVLTDIDTPEALDRLRSAGFV